MPTCYIAAAMPLTELPEKRAEDLWIAADAGAVRLREKGYAPDLCVGDFDSSDAPTDCPVIRHPVRKDDTDTMLAAREGLARGCRDFVLLGAVGGLFDHTFANLQVLAFLKGEQATSRMETERETVFLLSAGDRIMMPSPIEGKRLSVFAYGGDAVVTLEGLSYSGDRIPLTPNFPIGAGNLFLDEEARVTVHEGTVLLVTEK